ncbi:MAG: ankyrin repeat domain-containing protein [Gammaproteobacteria bacterium]
MNALMSCRRAGVLASLVILLAWSGALWGATLLTPKELSAAIYARNPKLVAKYLNDGGDPNVCVPVRPPKNADPAWSASANWCMNLGRLLITQQDRELALLALRKGALRKPTQIQDALGVAIRAELPTVVEALINLGAKVNRRAGAVDQPLMEAANEGDLEIVKELVRGGADISATDPLGFTSIGTALDKGHEAVADYLVQHGAALTMKTSNGYQLISVAVLGGSAKFVSALAALGFNMNVEDINGQTPLMFALSRKIQSEKRGEIVALLLQHGADACHKDHAGYTALDYAEKEKETEVIKILQNAERACGKQTP